MAPEKLRFDFSHKAGVTDAELRKIEEISTSYIRQNCPVFAEDMPLATARQINGVRAVFGETYPDPVRVVSVGVPIPDLMENVKDDRWRSVSVEFCGGTHVQKTGDIKDLIITEESGIAKGIRRIIAITGEDAHAAQRTANLFSDHLTTLSHMAHGPEKEQAVKDTQADLNKLTISTLTKSELRDRFGKIHKEMVEAQKAHQKAETKTALDAVTRYLADDEAGHQHVVVLRLPISLGNPKTISEVLNHVKAKAKDKSIYAFAVDGHGHGPEASGGTTEAGGRVAHGCYVSEKHKATVEAGEWSKVVSNLVGGKAGGKGGQTSQGIGSETSKVDEAIDLAEKWFVEKMKL